MPRLLSAALTAEKNRLQSDHPWTMLFQLDIAGAPAPIQLAAFPEPIVFHGQVFERFVVDVDDLETPTNASLVNWRVTKQNVDQQLISLLETYWYNVIDPDWQVLQWEIDVLMPDETPYETANVFSVLEATTDYFVCAFDLVAEGVSLSSVIPKRRYTSSMGFPNLPRAGQ